MKATNLLWLFMGFLLALNLFSSSVYAWWNSAWQYRRPITIDNTGNSNTLTDYQVFVNVSYDSDMQTDFDDLRFVDSDDATELSYWVEDKVDGSYAEVWVKVPSIPASSNKTIYMYYGNGGVTSESNGEGVFEFFDDFNDNSFNTTKWIKTLRQGTLGDSDVTEQNQRIEIFSDLDTNAVYGIRSNEDISGDFEIKVVNLNTNFAALDQFILDILLSSASDTTTTEYIREAIRHDGGELDIYYSDAGTVEYTDNGAFSFSEPEKYLMIRRLGSTLYIYKSTDGETWTQIYSDSSNALGTNDINIYLGSYYGFNAFADNVIVRKYTDPEPQVTIGSEQILTGNLAPVITIFSPQETTYYTTNITFNFTVTDDNSTTFHVKAWIGTTLIYDNTTYQNNTNVEINLSSYLTEAGTYYVKVWANDTDTNNPGISESTVYFTVDDFEIQSVSFNSVVGELTLQTFSESVTINNDLIENVSTKLVWNGTDMGYHDNFHSNTFYKSITIPLTKTDGQVIQFYFSNEIHYKNGSVSTINSSYYNQTVVYTIYIQSANTNKQNYIETETIRITSVINRTQCLSVEPELTLIFEFDGTNKTREIPVPSSGWLAVCEAESTYYEDFYIGQIVSNEETKNWAVYLNVSYNGTSRIVSVSSSIMVYKIVLTDCSSLTSTVTLTFNLKDENNESKSPNGNIEMTFSVWKDNTSEKRNYSFEFENVTSANICIYPSWASYHTDMDMIYYATDYTQRTYYLNNATINNQTQTINLYLIPSSDSGKVLIYIKDANDQKVSDVYVKILRYYYGTNVYKTVTIGKSDLEGKFITYLQLDTAWYMFILEKNNEVLNTYSPMQIADTIDDPEELTLYISTTLPEFFHIFSTIDHNCTFNSATNVTRCTFTDTSGLTKQFCLVVKKINMLGEEEICSSCLSSTSGTLTCSLGNVSGDYKYDLYLVTNSGNKYLVEQNYLNFVTGVTTVFGSYGLFIGIMLVLSAVGLSIINPFVSGVVAVLGLAMGQLMGLYEISIAGFVSLIIIAIMIMIGGMRRGA